MLLYFSATFDFALTLTLTPTDNTHTHTHTTLPSPLLPLIHSFTRAWTETYKQLWNSKHREYLWFDKPLNEAFTYLVLSFSLSLSPKHTHTYKDTSIFSVRMFVCMFVSSSLCINIFFLITNSLASVTIQSHTTEVFAIGIYTNFKSIPFCHSPTHTHPLSL